MVVLTLLFLSAEIILKGQCNPQVTISTPSSGICQGSYVVFTATPLNAGNAPSFQWKVNGVDAGSNSNVFTSSSLNNSDRIWVDLTPDPSCPDQTPVASNVILMTVNDLKTPQLRIAVSAGTVCAGNPVTFTATDITEGGLSPVFQWRVNGTDSGGATASPIFSAILNNNDNVSVVMISSADCAINPAVSNSITVTVNPLPAVNITPSGPTTFCQGGSVTLTSSPGSSYSWSTGVTTQSINVGSSGSYFVIVSDGNGCSANSAASIVTVNPLPLVYNVTGGGAYCNGGLGLIIGLSGSEAGINYQLYRDAIPAGPSVAGTGAALSFGNLTIAGTYTVLATNSTTSCTRNMSGAATITINPLPTAFALTGGGGYCSGGTGLPIGLGGSQSGVSYQLQNGGVNTGTPVAGTGGIISFGLRTTAGTYTVVATNVTTSCPQAMSGSVSITINPLPALFNVTGGGAYCSGSAGAAIGLSGSQIGVNYQLRLGGTNTGSPVAGTGSPISFGNQIATGTYTVVATNATTSCSQAMAGSVNVNVNPLPNIYNVTGGGAYCSGGSGVLIGLSDSRNGISYQLYMGASPVGAPVAGTNSAISFGNQSAAGTYTVLATNSTTSCTQNMSGSATITINPLPTVFNLTGGGAYCAGSSGVAIGLSGSQIGVNYQLRLGAANSGSPFAGTGGVISFGLRTTAGMYTVVATNATTSCTQNMQGSATITINPLPTAFSVTGGGSYCTGGAGVAIGLNGSQSGVNYQLRVGGTNTGSPVAGTGSPITFGNQTAAGAFTVVATNATTSCNQNMTGSATITINPLPGVFNVTGGGAYCAGSTGIAIGLSGSQGGVSYQLQIGGVNSGSPVAGTGGVISFGLRTVAGNYTVLASNASTSCTQNMSGGATITINPLPASFSVTGGGAYCAGSAGIPVGLSGSQGGVNYQLRINGANTGGPVSGTGSSISFGNQAAAGTYTVVATSETTSCTQIMNGSVTVTINPLPTVAPISGPTTVCLGSTITLTNTTGGGVWTSSAPGIASVSAAGVVSGSSAGTATISYSVTNGNGCTRTVNSTVTVNSTTVTITPAGPTTFCKGGSVILTASGASTYSWSPVDGLSITTGSTVIASPEVTITYTVTGTASGCTGNAQATITVNQRPEGIMSSDPAVCSGSNSGTVSLTITDGSTVLGWESSTNGGTSWTPYTPSVNQYTTTYLNLTQTTVYRALLQLNGCQAYSSIGIIPVNNVLPPVVTASSTVSCLNTALVLTASGYGQPPFPVEDFQNANPAGWSGDDAAANNEDPNSNWALTNNGKIFNGRAYNSQALPTNSKFLIVTGITDEADHNATLTAPPFSLVGTINPVLSFYTALNFNDGASGIVEISTDGGNTYTSLITYTGPRNFGNPDNGWVNVTYSLVSYINQPDVMIRFNYTGTAGSNWGIDNVGIISTFQPIVYNWSPLDHMTPSTGDTPSVTIIPDVGPHHYCVTSTTAAGCESEPVCIDINVLPLPVCNITGTDGPVCPSSPNIFSAPGGMRNYTWSITGNGRISSGFTAQNVTVTSGTGCNLPFTITLTITDNNGCVSTCSRTVTVQDISAPIITCPAVNAEYIMDAGVSYYTAVGTEFNASATDNCTLTSITHNLPYSSNTTLAGYHFPSGSTTVTWTAMDACGLTATCQIIITVIDNQPPAITCPPAINVQCAADVPAPYINYAAFVSAGGLATDNNQIDPALFTVRGTDIITSQTSANRYTITRTYQITDLSGNTAECTQAIIVNDQTAPVIAGCPADQVFCATPTNIFTIPSSIAATDNCSGPVNITYEIAGATARTGSGSNASGLFSIGASTITWTATDVCGNTSTCTTNVTVNPVPETSPIYHR